MAVRDPRQRAKLFAGIFFIAIMVLSTAGFVFNFQSDTASYDYNGFDFVQRKNAWELKLKSGSFLFGLHPSQLESLPVSANLSRVFSGLQQAYITYDSQSEGKIALAEVAFDFEQRLSSYANVFVISGLIDPNETSLPGITCDNATSSVPVVAFVLNNATSISAEGNCITVSASGEWDLLGLEERMLYSAIGVMQ